MDPGVASERSASRFWVHLGQPITKSSNFEGRLETLANTLRVDREFHPHTLPNNIVILAGRGFRRSARHSSRARLSLKNFF